jgi:hypothetical protein
MWSYRKYNKAWSSVEEWMKSTGGPRWDGWMISVYCRIIFSRKSTVGAEFLTCVSQSAVWKATK